MDIDLTVSDRIVAH